MVDNHQTLLGLDRRKITPPVGPHPIGQDHAIRELLDIDELPVVAPRSGHKHLHKHGEINDADHFPRSFASRSSAR
jgi:hypothetical protein